MHKPPPLRKNYETDNGYPWIVVYLILFIWLFFNLVMAAKHAQGATIYAAPLSTECRPSNPGTGTQGDPYRSVHYALVEGVSCGDTLRLLAGVYQFDYTPFANDATHEQRQAACDGDMLESNPGFNDGNHAILPLIFNCAQGNEIIVENNPGDTVVLDGTISWLHDGSNQWRQCESNSQCGSDTGLSLPNGSDTYYHDHSDSGNVLNHGSAMLGQMFVYKNGPPSDPGIPGTFIHQTRTSSEMEQGFFMPLPSRNYAVRLPAGWSRDPDDHFVGLSGKLGTAAGYTISARTANSKGYIVRRNPSGGRFIVRHSYYGFLVEGRAERITGDGIEFVNMGGRDFGGCFRLTRGGNVLITNFKCFNSVAHGVYFYGGGPQDGHQLFNSEVSYGITAGTGRGWIAGGGIGTSLGTCHISKNCENCRAIGNWCMDGFRNAIQGNYSVNQCDGQPCSQDNFWVEGNILENHCHFRSGDNPYFGAGDCAGVNVVANPANNGHAHNPTVINNFVRTNHSPPITGGGNPHGIQFDGPEINSGLIANNTLSDIAGGCITLRYQTSGPTTVINNIMNNCGICNGQECNLFLRQPNFGDVIWNNVFAPDGDNAVRYQENGSSIPHSNVTSVDAQALVVQPDFWSARDLHIKSGSPFINTGRTTDAPDDDGDGEPRVGVPDRGADEFTVTHQQQTPRAPTGLVFVGSN